MDLLRPLTRWLGGAGSGNFGHSGRPGAQGGSAPGEAVAPKPFTLNRDALKDPDASEREFYRAIREQYPNGLPVFHETFLENEDSVKKNGLEPDSFASIGKTSEFVTRPNKLILKIQLTPQESRHVTPDMEYFSENDNAWANLLEKHNGVYGAYISVNNEAIPARRIKMIKTAEDVGHKFHGNQWTNNLSEDETKALTAWSYNPDRIKEAQRGGRPSKYQASFDAALEKLPRYDGPIYRGVHLSDADAEALAAQDTITLGSAASFSTERDRAKIFADGGEPNDSFVLFRVDDNHAGRSLPNSLFPEHEVIAPKGTTYAVVSREQRMIGKRLGFELTLREKAHRVAEAAGHPFHGNQWTGGIDWKTKGADGLIAGIGKTFDITKMKSRKFLFSPRTKELAIGGERDAGGSYSHADALIEAGRPSYSDYDHFSLHGFLGQGPEYSTRASSHGVALFYDWPRYGDREPTPYEIKKSDAIEGALKKMIAYGHVTKDTLVGNAGYGAHVPLAESMFGYLVNTKRKRAAAFLERLLGGKGSGNFGHKGRPGLQGGSAVGEAIGFVDLNGHVTSKVLKESAWKATHWGTFGASAELASPARRFRYSGGAIHWDGYPTAESYFSVEDHFLNKGWKVKGHKPMWGGDFIPEPAPLDRAAEAVGHEFHGNQWTSGLAAGAHEVRAPFDLTKVGSRRFLYNSSKNRLIVGPEDKGYGDHAEVLASALNRDLGDDEDSARVYDSFDLRGWMGTNLRKWGPDPAGKVVITQMPTGHVDDFDATGKLAERLVKSGGMTGDTLFGGYHDPLVPLGQGDHAYALKHRRAAAGFDPSEPRDEHGRWSPAEGGLEDKPQVAPRSFDIKKIGDRRFMFNPDTGKLLIGAEIEHNDRFIQGKDDTHAELLDIALNAGAQSPQVYDSYSVHGFLGTNLRFFGEKNANGVVYTYPPLFGDRAFFTPEDKVKHEDDVDKLMRRLVQTGGANKNTQLRGHFEGSIGDSPFGYLTEKRKRAAEEAGHPFHGNQWTDHAHLITPGQRYDVAKFAHDERRFLYDPERDRLIVGASEPILDQDYEGSHADAHTNAMAIHPQGGVNLARDYDKYKLRGYLFEDAYTGVPSVNVYNTGQEELSRVDRIDAVTKLVKNLVSQGGATGKMKIVGYTGLEKTTIKESFKDILKKHGRALAEFSLRDAEFDENEPLIFVPNELKTLASSTQVDVPSNVAESVRIMGKSIPDDQVLGREDDPHVTVLYGIHADHAEQVRPHIEGWPPVRVTVGPLSVFSQPDQDVLKFDVDSPDLHALNGHLKDTLGATNDYPNYQPHITVAYLKPGLGQAYAGAPNDLTGRTFTLDRLTFSNDAREKTLLPLGAAVRQRAASQLIELVMASVYTEFEEVARFLKASHPIHRVADSHKPAMTAVFASAFANARKTLDLATVTAALERGQEPTPDIETALITFENSLKDKLAPIILECVTGGAKHAANSLNGLKTAEFNPNEPRDDHGRWTDAPGIGGFQEIVPDTSKIDANLASARSQAVILGFPSERIRSSSQPRSFYVGNQSFTEGAHYDPNTREIVIQQSVLEKSTYDQVQSLTAHEVSHDAWENVYQSGDQSDEVQSFNAFITDRAGQLAFSDGVTDYSAAYWKQWQETNDKIRSIRAENDPKNWEHHPEEPDGYVWMNPNTGEVRKDPPELTARDRLNIERLRGDAKRQEERAIDETLAEIASLKREHVRDYAPEGLIPVHHYSGGKRYTVEAPWVEAFMKLQKAYAVVREKRGRKLAGFDPNQPRDDHGRWDASDQALPTSPAARGRALDIYGVTGNRTAAIHAVNVATAFGFPLAKISAADLSRSQFRMAGKRWTSIANFNPKTGDVQFDKRLDTDRIVGSLTHEMTHAAFKDVTTANTPEADEFKNFITVFADDLSKNDGVTPYSQAHWERAWSDGRPGVIGLAIEETLSEISKVKVGNAQSVDEIRSRLRSTDGIEKRVQRPGYPPGTSHSVGPVDHTWMEAHNLLIKAYDALHAAKPKAAAGFNESQPRDDHGRWESGEGTSYGSHFSLVSKKKLAVRELARELGFDPDNINFEDIDRKFEVGGKTFNEGGHYSKATGEITINRSQLFNPTTSLRQLVAHEISHDAYHMTVGLYEAGPDVPVPKETTEIFDFMATHAEELERDDGVTGYTRAYWDEYKQALADEGEANEEFMTAVNETLADITAGPYMSTSVRERKNYGEPSPVWKELHAKIWKAYRDLRKE